MTPRTPLFLAALLTASLALQMPIVEVAHAQVKEQWNIGTPPPSEADSQAKPAAAAGKPAAAGEQDHHGLPTLKNPLAGNPTAIAEGKELFVSMACSGCHGAGGGGGMCPPVINSIWVYGDDDTTLFNLIKLGSVGLRGHGYTRIGHENVVGDMPPFESVVNDEQAWKLISYIRSRYAGDQ